MLLIQLIDHFFAMDPGLPGLRMQMIFFYLVSPGFLFRTFDCFFNHFDIFFVLFLFVFVFFFFKF